MAETTAPRLTGGALASLVLHGGLVAAFLLLRGKSPGVEPTIYKVQLLAAPAGERTIGAVQPAPETPPPVEKPPPRATKTVAPKTPTPAPAPKKKIAPTPRPVTATAPPKPEEKKQQTPPPTAGGGPTGGKGADVATVDTPGIEFPYKYYTDNIVSQIIQQFGSTPMRFTAEVRFVIRRDGSVDPKSIELVTPSPSYPFNQKAIGSIEAVANAKQFGPLPPGFREDILTVSFRFSPSLIR